MTTISACSIIESIVSWLSNDLSSFDSGNGSYVWLLLPFTMILNLHRKEVNAGWLLRRPKPPFNASSPCHSNFIARLPCPFNPLSLYCVFGRTNAFRNLLKPFASQNCCRKSQYESLVHASPIPILHVIHIEVKSFPANVLPQIQQRTNLDQPRTYISPLDSITDICQSTIY